MDINGYTKWVQVPARAIVALEEICAHGLRISGINGACRCLGDYREAIISTIEVEGDCDTNSAIVGGIVAAYGGQEAIPVEWLRVRERLGGLVV